MKRSIFFILAAILGLGFGLYMFLAPERALDGFGLSSTDETNLLIRGIGGLVISMGMLNWLVRHHLDSQTLASVLLINIFVHVLALLIDGSALMKGVLLFSNVIPGFVVHLFIIIGSFYYISKMTTRSGGRV